MATAAIWDWKRRSRKSTTTPKMASAGPPLFSTTWIGTINFGSTRNCAGTTIRSRTIRTQTTPKNQQINTSGLRDNQSESDGFLIFSSVHTFNPDAVLTVSPFYHRNSASYKSPLTDTPWLPGPPRVGLRRRSGCPWVPSAEKRSANRNLCFWGE